MAKEKIMIADDEVELGGRRAWLGHLPKDHRKPRRETMDGKRSAGWDPV